MSTQELGKRSAVARADTSGHSGPNPTVTLKLRVENLGVAFHKGTRVTLTYTAPYTGSLVPVNGLLDELKRPVPIRGGPPQPVILIVDGLRHTVPRGTLVSVDTRELR